MWARVVRKDGSMPFVQVMRQRFWSPELAGLVGKQVEVMIGHDSISAMGPDGRVIRLAGKRISPPQDVLEAFLHSRARLGFVRPTDIATLRRKEDS